MFAIAAHADEREAHIREVEQFGQRLPEGSYGRRNRQAIAARETRVAVRLLPGAEDADPARSGFYLVRRPRTYGSARSCSLGWFPEWLPSSVFDLLLRPDNSPVLPCAGSGAWIGHLHPS